MPELMGENMAIVYALLVIGPFVQEDAATVAAASLAASGAAPPALVFAMFLLALLASDVWKYWLGRAAHRFEWARAQAERPSVLAAGAALRGNIARTLITVRFLPGARIATYLAAGYVRTPFAPFAAYLTLSGALFVSLIFAAFMLLGDQMGERVRQWMPVAALAAIAIAFGAALLRRARRRWRRADKKV